MESDRDAFGNDFGRVWASHVQNWTWLLIQCRQHFGGDMDRLLVLAVIGERTLAARNVPKELAIQDFGSGRQKQVPREPINPRSIADFSGIPRETVRRKLQDLTSLGWVERDEHGNFAATQKAAVDLSPLTDVGIKYLIKMKAVLAEPEELVTPWPAAKRCA